MDNSPTSLRLRLSYPDAQLRAECEVDTHRASGLLVSAQERRSQHENLRNALARLREALAVQCRAPLPTPWRWPQGVHVLAGQLRVSERNPALPHVLGAALDALVRRQFPGSAALGVSTSSYVRFLSKHAKAWEEANRMRGCGGWGG